MTLVCHKTCGYPYGNLTNRRATATQSERLEEQFSESQKQISAMNDELRTKGAMIGTYNRLLRQLLEIVAKCVSIDLCLNAWLMNLLHCSYESAELDPITDSARATCGVGGSTRKDYPFPCGIYRLF
jgi:hypothetical protein